MTKAELVIAAAEEEWSRQVKEPDGDHANGAAIIDGYIRGNRSMVWGWLKRYKRNGQSAWCGAFAAHCYGVAGLSRRARRKHLPSTYRLHRWLREDASRRVEYDQLQPGDIGVVGPLPATRGASKRLRKARPVWGKHIVLIHAVYDDHVDTIEGNAHGHLYEGNGEGVVTRTRPLSSDDPKVYRILYGVRPLGLDYDPLT